MSGSFSVKAYFNQLEGASFVLVPTKMPWNPYVPSKISFFCLGGLVGKDSHFKSIKKRGFHLASKCPFCWREEEEPEHILIHCTSIWGQWTDLLFAFGVSWACPLLVKDLIQSWLHFPVKKKVKAIWRVAPLILLWAIWKERNRIILKMLPFLP